MHTLQLLLISIAVTSGEDDISYQILWLIYSLVRSIQQCHFH